MLTEQVPRMLLPRLRPSRRTQRDPGRERPRLTPWPWRGRESKRGVLPSKKHTQHNLWPQGPSQVWGAGFRPFLDLLRNVSQSKPSLGNILGCGQTSAILTRKAGLGVTDLKGNGLLGVRQKKREEPLPGGLALRKSWNGCEILLSTKRKPPQPRLRRKPPECIRRKEPFPTSLQILWKDL